MIETSIHYTDEHPTAQICMEDLQEFNIHWILASRIWSKQQQAEEHNSIKFCMNRLGLQVLVGHACNRTALKYRTIFLFMLYVLSIYYHFCRRLKTVFLGRRTEDGRSACTLRPTKISAGRQVHFRRTFSQAPGQPPAKRGRGLPAII